VTQATPQPSGAPAPTVYQQCTCGQAASSANCQQVEGGAWYHFTIAPQPHPYVAASAAPAQPVQPAQTASALAAGVMVVTAAGAAPAAQASAPAGGSMAEMILQMGGGGSPAAPVQGAQPQIVQPQAQQTAPPPGGLRHLIGLRHLMVAIHRQHKQRVVFRQQAEGGWEFAYVRPDNLHSPWAPTRPETWFLDEWDDLGMCPPSALHAAPPDPAAAVVGTGAPATPASGAVPAPIAPQAVPPALGGAPPPIAPQAVPPTTHTAHNPVVPPDAPVSASPGFAQAVPPGTALPAPVAPAVAAHQAALAAAAGAVPAVPGAGPTAPGTALPAAVAPATPQTPGTPGAPPGTSPGGAEEGDEAGPVDGGDFKVRVAAMFLRTLAPGMTPAGSMTLAQIGAAALGLPPEQVVKGVSTKLGKALVALGWTKAQKDGVFYYTPSDSTTATSQNAMSAAVAAAAAAAAAKQAAPQGAPQGGASQGAPAVVEGAGAAPGSAAPQPVAGGLPSSAAPATPEAGASAGAAPSAGASQPGQQVNHLILLVDVVVAGNLLPAVQDLEPWCARVLRALEKAGGVPDIRFFPGGKDHPYAFGGWKGALRDMVAKNLPVGMCVLRVGDDEVKKEFEYALRQHAYSVVEPFGART
jgi:hypothetical protein